MYYGNKRDKIFIESKKLYEVKEVINSDLSIRGYFKHTKDPNFDIKTIFRPINLDDRRKEDLINSNGFVITAPYDIKKDTNSIRVDPNGIFSNRYGPRLSDLNAFIGNYKCKCGALTSRINLDVVCNVCKEPVTFVDDNLQYMGWMVLRENYIIHPGLYKNIDKFLSTYKPPDFNKKNDSDRRLMQMLEYKASYNKNGIKIDYKSPYPNEPYYGIGMVEFYNKFDEIMEYYLNYFRVNSSNSYKNKLAQYEVIMKYKDYIFTQSIPVYSLLLRPIDLSNNGVLKYDEKNKMYVRMHTGIYRLNEIYDSKLSLTNEKDINKILLDVQVSYNELTSKLITEISVGKHSSIRRLLSGRVNMSERAVIVQDTSLRIDQIILPYTGLVIAFQPVIVNVLMNKYGMELIDAVNFISTHKNEPNEVIESILQELITHEPNGVPILLNRNPTISYGSILQLYCVGYSRDLSIKLSLQIIKLLGADFDGDALNNFHILNKDVANKLSEVFNPRNVMYISRMNGLFNTNVSMQRSQLTNVNKMVHISRENYSKEQLDAILAIKENNKKIA